MFSINRHCIAGNLGDDAKVFGTGEGSRTFAFSVATHGIGSNAEAQWHDVKAFAKTEPHVNYLREILRKGALVYVEGEVRKDTWVDAGETRSRRVIYASMVQVVPFNPSNNREAKEESTPAAPPSSESPAAPSAPSANGSRTNLSTF